MMVERLVGLVWNGRAHRARLPLRLVAVFVILAVFALGVSAVAPFLRSSITTAFAVLVPAAQATAAAGNLVFLATQAFTYLGGVYLTARFVDRRWFRDYGFRIDRDWWVDLLFGLVLGAALLAGVFLVEYAAGWIEVTGTFRIARPDFPFWPWFGWGIVTMVGIGVAEEVLLRGYLITNVAEGVTWFDRINSQSAVFIALLGSSVVFGVSHLFNPNAGLASTTGIFFAALMLGTAYVLTGELAIPIGLHITWNLFQGPVFGFPVSGLNFGLSIIAIEQAGPVVFTGGRFGPEAGVLGTIATLTGIGLILGWVRWREGHIRIDPSVVTPDLRSATAIE